MIYVKKLELIQIARMARNLKFEDIIFYNTSVYHYTLNNNKTTNQWLGIKNGCKRIQEQNRFDI